MEREEEKFLNYVGNLKAKENNFYTLPWGQVIVRGCDEEGELLYFRNAKCYKAYGRALWIQLQVAMFRDSMGLYAAYVCSECESMQGVESLTMDTDRAAIHDMVCLHSRAALLLLGDWQENWPQLANIPDTTTAHKVLLCPELSAIPPLRTTDMFLGAFQEAGRVSLLYSLTKAQKSLLCSKCSSRTCPCYRKFRETLDEILEEESTEAEVFVFY